MFFFGTEEFWNVSTTNDEWNLYSRHAKLAACGPHAAPLLVLCGPQWPLKSIHDYNKRTYTFKAFSSIKQLEYGKIYIVIIINIYKESVIKRCLGPEKCCNFLNCDPQIDFWLLKLTGSNRVCICFHNKTKKNCQQNFLPLLN